MNPQWRPRGSNQGGMREYNERVVLQAIRLNGALYKAELARFTGLSAQTIGLISQRLFNDGLLLRDAPVRGKVGQPSVPIRLNPDGAFSVGIKIGRRSTDLLLVDFLGVVRQRDSIQYQFPEPEKLFPLIQQRFVSLLASASIQANKLVGVGVAAPFQMGGWHRLLELSEAQSNDWNQLDLGAEIQKITDRSVTIAKDTAAACIAELVKGRGRDLKNFLYLFVDTFVGGGLVFNSQWYGGVQGNAGAVASIPLNPVDAKQKPTQKPPEQLIASASLWELEQLFRKVGLDATAAYDERAMQEPWFTQTQMWIELAAPKLAFAIVSGTAIVDVEAVVIDGSFCRPLLAALLLSVRESLQLYNWTGIWQPEIYGGLVGSDARALGGALLPLHEHFLPDHQVFLNR